MSYLLVGYRHHLGVLYNFSIYSCCCLHQNKKEPSLCYLSSLQAVNANDSNMLILQETWTDASCSVVVYAPVDVQSLNVVMSGGDSAYVALLPSGFAILPDGHSSGYGGPNSSCNGTIPKGGCNGGGTGDDGSGSLLTVGFQILVNNLPTAKLTVESVDTVNNLISCSIQKIKAALRIA